MNTSIQKWGNSQGVRLPKYLLEKAEMADNEEVEITVNDDAIIIKKVSRTKRKSLEELFAGYDGEYEKIDIDWGEPAGREIW